MIVVGQDLELEHSVRRMVGTAARITCTIDIGADAIADLVVVDAGAVSGELLEKIRTGLPDTPIVVMAAGNLAAGRLRVHVTPEDLGGFPYRQVVERYGKDILRDYLPALLHRHDGNVTRAAQAAGLERESVHRLLRRLRLCSASFRHKEG